MVKKKFSELDDGEGSVSSNSIVGFENETGDVVKSRMSVLVDGLTVKYIHSLSDFPAPISGVIKLEQDTVYVIAAEIFISDDILIPAGWNGHMRSTHTPKNSLIYLGSNSLINTLNIDGIILSIADSGTNPGVKSTVTTSIAHGLSDGDTINITGTLVETIYTQPRLVISNVTASTFDVDIVFTATDTGLFDTGYLGIQLPRMSFLDSGFGTLFNVSATPVPESIFVWDNIAALNFKSLGTIRNAPNINMLSSLASFIDNGLTLENCTNMVLFNSSFSNIDIANTTSKCVTLTGDKTKVVIVNLSKLNVANPAQHPIRIDPSIIIPNAIEIINSPDNNVAVDYFDVSLGGLTQKDNQVNAFGNGIRADSKNIASVKVISNGTATNADATFSSFNLDGNAELGVVTERWELVDSSTGRVRYIGTRPFSGMLSAILNVDSTNQDYSVTFEKNSTPIDEETGIINIAKPTQISLIADITAVNGDEFEPQVRTSSGTNTITVSQMAYTIE